MWFQALCQTSAYDQFWLAAVSSQLMQPPRPQNRHLLRSTEPLSERLKRSRKSGNWFWPIYTTRNVNCACSQEPYNNSNFLSWSRADLQNEVISRTPTLLIKLKLFINYTGNYIWGILNTSNRMTHDFTMKYSCTQYLPNPKVQRNHSSKILQLHADLLFMSLHLFYFDLRTFNQILLKMFYTEASR